MFKYPKTMHLEQSRLQSGDAQERIKFSSLLGKNIVIEEKVDGANAGISFERGELRLQSRGHYLTGGARERHYELFKREGAEKRDELYSILGERFILFGEWLYAKHKVYYDALPSLFLEFDIYDKERGVFLDTPSRRKMLFGSSVLSVPLLYEGKGESKKHILSFLKNSAFITENHLLNLQKTCLSLGLDYAKALDETDPSPLMEGLYIKVEEGGVVRERMKFVRDSYIQPSAENWLRKPIIPNKLK